MIEMSLFVYSLLILFALIGAATTAAMIIALIVKFRKDNK